MTPETYRILHVLGALLLFLGLGGVLATAGRDGGKPSSLFFAMHGIGLLVLLVCGIGVLHKGGYGWPNWALTKIACWVLLGAVPVLMRRGVLPRSMAILVVVAIGGTAAWLGIAKPF